MDNIWKTVKFIPLAPLIGLVIGFVVMIGVYWIFRRWRPTDVDVCSAKGQLVSAALYSLGHGGNDAQKTMGIIMALLIAGGVMRPDTELSLTHWNTAWIILSCHAAMGIGTAFGGWRIVKTMGMKITKLKPVGGFCAETAGAATLFMAHPFGHSGLDHPHDYRRDCRRRRDHETLGDQMGGGRANRLGVDLYDSGLGTDRRRLLLSLQTLSVAILLIVTYCPYWFSGRCLAICPSTK